jgi:transcriptional regulator with XRE-family HTH domain
MYGEKIKQLRKNAGLSQADLASLIGVSRPNISFWENSAYPPLDAIEKVCNALNIEVWRFFINDFSLAQIMDVPAESIELVERIAKLDMQKRSDLLEIVEVMVSKFEKMDTGLIAGKSSQQYPINLCYVNNTSRKSQVYNIDSDEVHASYFAQSVGNAALQIYFERLTWIK